MTTELTLALIVAFVAGAIGVPAAIWTQRRIVRLVMPGGQVALLLVHLVATISGCLVLLAVLLGPGYIFGIWLPRGAGALYALSLLLGAAIGRYVSDRRGTV